ncbi:hypothetical protein F5887DRAFT_1237316 [Amanita rubescens]|nr:hypothetical protein F5887DRAFT_1237316 [Amanita rubescens]
MSRTPRNVKLWLSLDDGPKLALSIPLNKCCTFARFAIYGREGYLSTSEDGPEIDDYTAEIEPNAYFFISEGEACLVDADVMDDRTSNASQLTTRRNDFRTKVIERDGTCVITDEPVSNCVGCHIIPHEKGSNYISNVVRNRSGTDDSVNDINDINDIRNGLLLSNLLHRPFGFGKIAFLKTPNFALDVDDIPYESEDQDQESPASRLTLHHFVNERQLGPVITAWAGHNSDARQPQDTSEWPPAIVVDLFYAAAALNAWGPKPFIKYVRENVHYGDDDDQDDDGDDQDDDDDDSMDGSGLSHVDAQMGNQKTGQSGSGRYALRSKDKTSSIPQKVRRFADLMEGVSALWMQSSRVDKLKPEDAHASSLARNEGVKTWLQSIEGPGTN